MKNSLLLMLSLILLISFAQTTFANENNDFESKEPMGIEEVYKVKGYSKDVDKVIHEFENDLDTNIKFPPPKCHLK